VVRVFGESAGAWLEAGANAEAGMGRGRWDEAAAAFERKLALYPPSDLTDAAWRLRCEDQYNLACVRALGGRTEAALDALECALEDGFAVVDYDHVREDPDLDALRGEPRFKALIERLSSDAAVEVTPSEGAGPGPQPLVVVLAGAERGGDPAVAIAAEARSARCVVALAGPPYRVGRTGRAWQTRRERGAAAARKAAFALEAGVRAGGDPRRCFLAGGGPEAAVAWEILLRDPGPWTGGLLAVRWPRPEDVLDRDRALLLRGPRLVFAGRLPATAPAGVHVEEDSAAALAWLLRQEAAK